MSSLDPLEQASRRIEAKIGRILRLVFLPPLLPSLVFVGFTTWGGLTNTSGGNFYMPILMEVWAFGVGMLGWGGVHIACLPMTFLLTRWFCGLLTGLSYAVLVSLCATIGVWQEEWLGRPETLFSFSLVTLVGLPVLLTILIAWIVLVRERGGLNEKTGQSLSLFAGQVARNLFMSLYLLWLAAGAWLLFTGDLLLNGWLIFLGVGLPWLVAALLWKTGYWTVQEAGDCARD